MHIPVGVNKLCQSVVSFRVWQRYSLTLLCGFLICCVWYFSMYQMLEKKYQAFSQELSVIADHQHDAQSILVNIDKLEAECDQLGQQLKQSCKSVPTSDLLLWYDLINKENMIIESCTSADLVDHEWYSVRKLSCSFKSTFANFMKFFEKITHLKELYVCDELALHSNENHDLKVHCIFQRIQVKESGDV